MKTNTLETELREAIEARDAIVQESAALQERSVRLEEIESTRNEAQAELDAIARAEADALTAWARDGLAGRAPQPDAKVREAAAKKLAAAEYSMRAVGIARRQLDADRLALTAKLESAQAGVRSARARVLGDRYSELVINIREATDTTERLQVVAQQLYLQMVQLDAHVAGAIDSELSYRRVAWINGRSAAIGEGASRDLAQITQAIAA